MSSGHIWQAPEMEKCELCGDKDWMADKYCAGNPDVADKRKEWLKQLAEQDRQNDACSAL